MTVKLVALYAQPDDTAAFDEHYAGTHVPLVDKMPGLQRWDYAKFVAAADGGDQTYYQIAELHFADQAALDAAFGSTQGKAAAADYQSFAPPGSRMFVASVVD
jgi:uncharacterized protein (TIGR02118 family)